MKHGRLDSTLLILIGAQTLLGQELPLDLPRAAEPNLILRLGGEADSDQGRLAEGRLSWQPTLSTLLSAGYTYSTLASTNASHTDTRIVSLSGEHSFGAFGVGGGFDRAVVREQFSSNTFSLRPFFEHGAWRFEVSGSHRKTEFERIGFENVPITRTSGTLYVTGSAQLNLTTTGLGGVIDYMGETWHFYAAYDGYRHGDFEGTTSVSALRDGNGRLGTPIFNALAGRLVTRLQRLAGSRATAKASLLDNSAVLGLDLTIKAFRVGLEVNRDKDHLTGNVSDGVRSTLALDATHRLSVELLGGATQSEMLGTIRFIGLSLVFRSRPRL